MGPYHYLKQCWVIINWTLRNKLQRKFNQNTTLFIHENASENIICEMVAILSRGRWVNHLGPSEPWYIMVCFLQDTKPWSKLWLKFHKRVLWQKLRICVTLFTKLLLTTLFMKLLLAREHTPPNWSIFRTLGPIDNEPLFQLMALICIFANHHLDQWQ